MSEMGGAAGRRRLPDGLAGLGPDCVALLLERGVKAVAVDTLSPDVYGDGENQFSARNSFSRMNAMRLFPSTHA